MRLLQNQQGRTSRIKGEMIIYKSQISLMLFAKSHILEDTPSYEWDAKVSREEGIR